MQDIINRLRNKKGDEGFTLIELLVVVVIIGVLVAIAVPVYLNYRKGAADKSAQSDVRGAVSAIEQYYTDNGNTYPATPTATADRPRFDARRSARRPPKVTLSDKTANGLRAGLGHAPASSYKVCANNTAAAARSTSTTAAPAVR